MRTIFRLLFRSCASLGILLLISGVYINGFWISLIVGVLCGYIGHRISSRVECRDFISQFTMEFVAQVGAMVLVLTALDVLMGSVLIVNRGSLMTGVIGLAALHTLASGILGR